MCWRDLVNLDLAWVHVEGEVVAVATGIEIDHNPCAPVGPKYHATNAFRNEACAVAHEIPPGTDSLSDEVAARVRARGHNFKWLDCQRALVAISPGHELDNEPRRVVLRQAHHCARRTERNRHDVADRQVPGGNDGLTNSQPEGLRQLRDNLMGQHIDTRFGMVLALVEFDGHAVILIWPDHDAGRAPLNQKMIFRITKVACRGHLLPTLETSGQWPGGIRTFGLFALLLLDLSPALPQGFAGKAFDDVAKRGAHGRQPDGQALAATCGAHRDASRQALRRDPRS